MLTEEQLRSLADPIAGLFQDLEVRTIEEMARRIKEVGKISATDVHRLDELARLGFDSESLLRDVAATADKAEKEVADLLESVLKTEYDGYTLPTKVGFKDNAALQSLLQTISKETAETMRDYSRTTGFVNTKGKWQPLAKTYQDAVDKAVMEIRTGTEDFHGAMRRTIKNLTDHGMISKVDYESGYSRRLDSSVRNAIMGAQQRLSKAQAQLVGEQFGASGMEITWHMFPRPSHEDMGGKQYPMDVFNREIVPLLEEFNCYHRPFPIILGLSVPTYSEEQLSSLNASNHREIVFEGRTYTGYEATQVQRRLETAIRREKERALAFKASGDLEAEKVARAKVAALQGKYRSFSGTAGLSVKSNRTGVMGYSGREKIVSPASLARKVDTTVFMSKYSSDDLAKIQRALDNAPTEIKDFYSRYRDRIQFTPSHDPERGTYFYYGEGIHIKDGITSAEDLHTLMHEVGHSLDFSSMTRTGAFSRSSAAFGQAILDDYKALDEVIEATSGGYYQHRVFMGEVKTLLGEYKYSEVASFSDILDGASTVLGKKNLGVYFGYGHSEEYWAAPGALQEEAFAQLFVSVLLKDKSATLIERYLPKTFDVFKELISLAR